MMELVNQALNTLGCYVADAVRAIANLFLTLPVCATLTYLEEAELTLLSGEEKLKARKLWETSGAVVMAEAAELSSLKPQLDKLGVPLFAVVKENISSEIQNFRSYFSGEIFMDEKRRFFGPRERRMGLSVFLRVGVWRSGLRALKSGYLGNIRGEGFVLGGVFVIGAGQQGILLEHRESEFGDKVNIVDVLQAAKQIQKELVSFKRKQ